MTEKEIIDAVAALARRVRTLEDGQKTQLLATNAVKDDTAELLETFKALKGAWVVLNFIGKLAKPILIIGGIFAACHTAWKNIPWH